MEIVEHGGLLINAAFLPLLAAHGLDGFEAIRDFPGGEVITKKAVRSVVRITLDDGGQKRGFFLKRHRSSLWARVKGVLIPVANEDCGNEWNKIVLLTECGFSTATPVAYGERASLSLTLTEEIYDSVRVEDYIPKEFKEQEKRKKALSMLKNARAEVQTRIKNLERHSTQHKHDYTAKRAHMKKQWIVNKLTKIGD